MDLRLLWRYTICMLYIPSLSSLLHLLSSTSKNNNWSQNMRLVCRVALSANFSTPTPLRSKVLLAMLSWKPTTCDFTCDFRKIERVHRHAYAFFAALLKKTFAVISYTSSITTTHNVFHNRNAHTIEMRTQSKCALYPLSWLRTLITQHHNKLLQCKVS
jgi:hypothetical protein